MTRKHFIALAAALRVNAPKQDAANHKSDSNLFENLVEAVASVCRQANPRFNHARFVEASGAVGCRKSS